MLAIARKHLGDGMLGRETNVIVLRAWCISRCKDFRPKKELCGIFIVVIIKMVKVLERNMVVGKFIGSCSRVALMVRQGLPR